MIQDAATPPGDGGLREVLIAWIKDSGRYDAYETPEQAVETFYNFARLLPDAALDRPAEISARDEEGGWHDMTPPPAETRGENLGYTFGHEHRWLPPGGEEALLGEGASGQEIREPSGGQDRSSALLRQGQFQPAVDSASPSPAPKRWRGSQCGKDVLEADIKKGGLGTPDWHWCDDRSVKWCYVVAEGGGPVEPTGDDEARLIAGGTEALPE